MVGSRAQRVTVLRHLSGHRFNKMKLICFTPSDINWTRKKIRAVHLNNHTWLEDTFPFPKVIYNRCYNADTALVTRLEKEIGTQRCFNQINQFDKLQMYSTLNRWLSPHLPETHAYTPDTIVHLLLQHRIIFLKPCHGHMGKGVYRLELRESGEIHLSSHHFSPCAIIGNIAQLQGVVTQLIGTTPYLVQQGAPFIHVNNCVFDIRSLTQKNSAGLWTATNVISRVAYEGCFNTSISQYVQPTHKILHKIHPPNRVNEIMNQIYNLSLRSAEIVELDMGIHLCEASVDMSIDANGHLWIIEVNGQPQKALYKEAGLSTRPVYRKPLEYGFYLSKK